MASLASEISITQSAEFLSRLGRFGVTPEMVRKLNGDDLLARQIAQHFTRHPHANPQHTFLAGRDQFHLLEQANAKRDWGFTEEEFEGFSLVPRPSFLQVTDIRYVPVLVPYLPEKDGVSGPERTFRELLALAFPNLPDYYKWIWEGEDKPGIGVRLVEGIKHKPGLRWEVIDLSGGPATLYAPREHQEISETVSGFNYPDPTWNRAARAKMPHAGLLAAAWLHSGWLGAIVSGQVPGVWLPGYETWMAKGYWANGLYISSQRLDGATKPTLFQERGGHGHNIFCPSFADLGK